MALFRYLAHQWPVAKGPQPHPPLLKASCESPAFLQLTSTKVTPSCIFCKACNFICNTFGLAFAGHNQPLTGKFTDGWSRRDAWEKREGLLEQGFILQAVISLVNIFMTSQPSPCNLVTAYSNYFKTSLHYKAKSDAIDLKSSSLNDTENHRLLDVALRNNQIRHMGKLRPREGKDPA